MNKIIFDAILSLDSYNRGYDEKIRFLDSTSAVGQKIGNATIIRQSEIADNTPGVNVGFYALAYKDDITASITISYRGTDKAISLQGNDIINGWAGGAGFLTQPGAMAFGFYNSVATLQNNNEATDPRSADISLTGHSLGGGEAGLVAAVYGKSATLFNNMAFEAAADNLYNSSTSGLYASIMKPAVYGSYNGGNAWQPSYTSAPTSRIHTHYESGEALIVNRAFQQSPPHVETRGYTDITETVDRHKMAGLVISMYGNDTTMERAASDRIGTDWQNAGRFMWSALEDGWFAGKFITVGAVPGSMDQTGDWSGILRSILAYSAIDEGTLIFGDTGIKALYNDANDLGRALAGPVSATSVYATDLSKIFVEYAGNLALNKVLQSTAPTVVSGVLSYDATRAVVIADLTDATWARATPTTIRAGRDDMVYHALDAHKMIVGGSDLLGGILNLHWGPVSYDQVATRFDRIAVKATDSGAASLSDGGLKATMFIGAGGADIMTGSQGKDLMIGGLGTDTLIGGKGNDILYGGSGYDTADYSKDAAKGGTGAITVDLTGNRQLVTDGWGNQDALLAVEKVILSAGNDRVIMNPSAINQSLFFDGGAGSDTLSFNSSVFILDQRHQTESITKIWSANGQSSYTFANFETFPDPTNNFNQTYVILPDMRKAHLINDGYYSYPNVFVDYSSARNAASFDVVSYEGNSTATIGGLIQDINVSYNNFSIRGTNYGDYFHAGVSYTSNMSIFTGSGNDVIDNPESSGTWGNGGGASLMTVVYGGGSDVIRNAYCINTIKVGMNFSYADVTNVAYNWVASQVSTATVSFGNGNSITLENLLIDSVNTESVKSSGSLDRLTFESGGYILFKDGGSWSYVGGGSSTPSEIVGTWGDDVLKSSGVRPVYAMGGNDRIQGDAYNNVIYGGEGNDTLIGGGGTNELYGGEGNDSFILAGGSSNRILDVGMGGQDSVVFSDLNRSQITISAAHNEFFGPNGFYASIADISTIQSLAFANGETVAFADFLIRPPFSGTDAPETIDVSLYATGQTINLMGGNDAFVGSAYNDFVTGGEGDDVIEGQAGNDTLNGNNGTDTGSYARATAGVVVDLSLTTAQNTVGAGVDTLAGFENLTGSAFNDTLKGTAAANTIDGGGGNDIIDGGAGDDTLMGGDGTDLVIFASAFVGVSVDLLLGSYRFDGSGVENTLSGFENATGSSFDDVLSGDNGANVIDAGKGIDKLSGEAGDDTYIFRAGDSLASLGGEWISEMISEGADTIKFTGGVLPGDVRMWADSYGWLNIRYTANDMLISKGWEAAPGGGYYMRPSSIEKIVFDNGTVWDLQAGLPMTDTDDAHDIIGAAGNDVIDGRGGDDYIDGNAGNDTILGGAGNDSIYGDLGNDVIDGGDGNDSIQGNTGDDRLSGGAGTNSFYDESGNDLYVLSAISKNTISDASGINTLNLTGINFADLTRKLTGYKLDFSNAASTFSTTIYDYRSFTNIMFGNGQSMTMAQFTAGLYSTFSGNDTVNASASTTAVTINLLAGNDVFTGSNFNDNVTAGDGNDTVEGRGGNDALNGGRGTDTVTYVSAATAVTVNLATAVAQNTGGAGTDTVTLFENLTGSAFNDNLTGNTGANVINGGSGNDTIQGGTGNDTLIGGAGTDTLSYASASAAVTVSLAITAAQNTVAAGTDTVSAFENLTGSAFNDKLTGSTGNNVLTGGNGNDVIKGGAGNDILYGGAGADDLYGEVGNDRFVFQAGGGVDTVRDFSKTQDIIDIASLLTSYNPLTSAITDFVRIEDSGANSVLKIDANGGANSFVQIATLTGITGLTDEAALLSSGHIMAYL